MMNQGNPKFAIAQRFLSTQTLENAFCDDKSARHEPNARCRRPDYLKYCADVAAHDECPVQKPFLRTHVLPMRLLPSDPFVSISMLLFFSYYSEHP